jgi:ferredoxin
MTFVVTEGCHDCKYTDCVVVCPADCFYQDEKMLYIHPDECIDCCACCPECPVGAIFPEAEVPAKWGHYLEINAERARALKETGNITEKAEPLQGPECREPLPGNWMERGHA